jgi:hypothetical protein
LLDENQAQFTVPARKAASNIFERATQTEPEISVMMKSIQEETGAEFAGWDNRIKSEESINRKLLANMEDKGLEKIEEAESSLFDAVRYTMVYDNDAMVDGVNQAVEKLEKAGWDKLDDKWKNFFSPGDQYDGLNMGFINRDTGFQMEVQFHTQDSYNIKDKAHELYEQFRESDDPKERYVLDKQMSGLWVAYDRPDGWEQLPGMKIVIEGD